MGLPRFKRPVGTSEPCSNLYVANCGPAVGLTLDTIEAVFGAYGQVKGVHLADENGTRVIVSYHEEKSAESALKALNRRTCPELGGRSLHIQYSVPSVCQVKRLLNEGMDANMTAGGPKSLGVTSLHLAAKGDHLRVMDELLERGADIDARIKGACGWTPVHHAAKEEKRKAIRFLIRNGAFLQDDIHDTRFNPPLHYCPGLEWAYEEMRLLQLESSSFGEASYSSGN